MVSEAMLDKSLHYHNNTTIMSSRKNPLGSASAIPAANPQECFPLHVPINVDYCFSLSGTETDVNNGFMID